MSFYGAVAIALIGLMWFLLEFADRLQEKEILGTNIMMGLKLLIRMVAFAIGLPLIGFLERFAALELPTTTLNQVFSTMYLMYGWLILGLLLFLLVYYLIIGPVQLKELKEATEAKRKRDLV